MTLCELTGTECTFLKSIPFRQKNDGVIVTSNSRTGMLSAQRKAFMPKAILGDFSLRSTTSIFAFDWLLPISVSITSDLRSIVGTVIELYAVKASRTEGLIPKKKTLWDNKKKNVAGYRRSRCRYGWNSTHCTDFYCRPTLKRLQGRF